MKYDCSKVAEWSDYYSYAVFFVQRRICVTATERIYKRMFAATDLFVAFDDNATLQSDTFELGIDRRLIYPPDVEDVLKCFLASLGTFVLARTYHSRLCSLVLFTGR